MYGHYEVVVLYGGYIEVEQHSHYNEIAHLITSLHKFCTVWYTALSPCQGFNVWIGNRGCTVVIL